MANIKSQKKRIKTNTAAHERNKTYRTRLRTAERKVAAAVESGDTDAAREAYQEAARLYDKAATKGIVHRNRAANHKSKLAGMVSAIEG